METMSLKIDHLNSLKKNRPPKSLWYRQIKWSKLWIGQFFLKWMIEIVQLKIGWPK